MKLKLVKETRGQGYVKRSYTEAKESEASIQATLKQALETCGYIVGEVNKGRNAKGSVFFQTAGLPDLFVTHEAWPQGEWLGLELKTATGRLRPAQKALNEKGRTVVVRSVAEGLREVRDREEKVARASSLPWRQTTHYRITQMVEQFAGTAGDCLSEILSAPRVEVTVTEGVGK